LTLRSQGRQPAQRLEFDPQTGELVLRRRDDPADERVTPVDQIAMDGFA
jgi:hypothetical protein